VPVCKELNVDIVAYYPLARNLLATKLETAPSDWRASLPRYSAENLKKNQKISDILGDLAEKYESSPAQIALAWLFAKAEELGVTVIPIPGTTKVKNALSNMKATKVDISDPEDMKTLETLADLVAGERAGESYLKRGIESQK
jgi:aryl-alcohol dehydrogenase-like predicted oxidoreductase